MEIATNEEKTKNMIKLSEYNVKVVVENENYRVSFERKNKNMLGGGVIYLINSNTGQIVSQQRQQ